MVLSFEEASHVFDDPLRLSVPDRIEDGEQRWKTFGLVGGVVILMVAHTVIEQDSGEGIVKAVRLISARRADRSERRRYEEENH